MKEQDAANSFDKIPWGKQEDIDALNAELTRLRSELQRERELRKELVEPLEYIVKLEAKSGSYGPKWIEEWGALIKKAKLNN